MAAVMMRPIPRMERGAADSMSVAAMLVYILDVSGESIPRTRARIRKRRKQIIEVTMTFMLTLNETHGTARWIGFPLSKDVLGKALSTTVRIASTAKKTKERKTRRHNSELLHQMKDEN